jgi:transposase, IS30 family
VINGEKLYQYIPKKRPLSAVTEDKVNIIEQLLNNRPKKWGIKTPNEIFFNLLTVF